MTETICDANTIKVEPIDYNESNVQRNEENIEISINPNDYYVTVKSEPADPLGDADNTVENELSPTRNGYKTYEVDVGINYSEKPYDFSPQFFVSDSKEPEKKRRKRKSVPRKIIQAKKTSDASKDKTHACETCGKSYKSKPKLIIHIRVHTGERPFLCPVCKKGFRTNWTMKAHELTHLGLKPHCCGQCDKAYTTKQQLKIHTRSHTGERPFCCKICQKDFKDRWKLTLHEQTHSGLKPFECDKCDKKYTTKYQLTTHKRLHTKDKLFGCKICIKQFTEKCKLVVHERTHLGLKPYCCDLCDKKYRMKSHLKFHIESTHLQVKSKK